MTEFVWIENPPLDKALTIDQDMHSRYHLQTHYFHFLTLIPEVVMLLDFQYYLPYLVMDTYDHNNEMILN